MREIDRDRERKRDREREKQRERNSFSGWQIYPAYWLFV